MSQMKLYLLRIALIIKLRLLRTILTDSLIAVLICAWMVTAAAFIHREPRVVTSTALSEGGRRAGLIPKARGEAQERASVSHLQAHGEYLFWLDVSARTIYRVKRPVTNIPTLQSPPQTSEPQALWSGDPLESPTAFTIDQSGVIYVTDKKANAIFSLVPGSQMETVYSGELIRRPSAIVATNSRLYVADNHSHVIYSFEPSRKEIVEEYNLGEAEPDRLLATDGQVIALDSKSKTLFRFILDRVEAAVNQAPALEWKLVERKSHATFGRGVQTRLDKVIDDISDVSFANGIIYLLDLDEARMVLVPLDGGEPAVLSTDLLAERPHSLAASEDALYLSTGAPLRFWRMPALLPVTLDFVGDWTAPDVVEFYEYLRIRKLLPTKSIKVNKEIKLEELVNNQKLLPTGYIDEFQVLFCQLNSSLCTPQQKVPLPLNTNSIPPNYAIHLKEGQSVILPDLLVTTYTTRRNIMLPLDPAIYKPRDFKEFYNRPLKFIAMDLAPERYEEEELKKVLEKYNPSYTGSNILDEVQGYFSIPVGAGTVQAVVPREDLLNENSLISRLAAKKNIMGLSPVIKPQVQSIASRTTSSHVVLTFPRFADVQCQSIDPSLLSPAMELVKYCCLGSSIRPTIGIIDDIFNEKHPAFNRTTATGQPALQVFSPPSATNSEALKMDPPDRTSFKEEIDHGTYIAAIIGARREEGKMIGLLPESSLYGLSVRSLDQVLEQLDFIRVFNISLGEKHSSGGLFTGTERLKEVVVQHPFKLFVVAAGNEAGKVKLGSLASFGYLDNVIVVGATNVPPLNPSTNSRTQPSLFFISEGKGSNHHPLWVHVVAPGENIKGALYNNQYGEASGTSAAAAFVTSAAATLMAVEPNWQAWQIKFRLIATADLWTGTPKSDEVFAGELNFKRVVLDTKNVVLDHETTGVCRGEIEPVSLSRDLKIKVGNKIRSIPYDKILRIRRNGRESTNYTIIYYDERGADNFPERLNRYLEREISVSANSMRENFKFNFIAKESSPNCTSGEKTLKELIDFINTFTAVTLQR